MTLVRSTLATTLVALTLVAVRSARADDTRTYVVEPGDTCLGVAIRIVGDRSALTMLHRLNPQLGPVPHELVPGSIIKLPPPASSGPDARLTRAHGDVKIRKPSATSWDIARLGLDLYRAYRVGAAPQASAELTFADDAILGMRERTIVVIYGPEKRLAKVLTATADLERGSLESRLGELDGRPIIVRTRAGEADLRAGDVVLTASDNGTSILSNHRGAPVELRQRTNRRRAVKVAAGMGTRVLPGKAPEKPRPLPATPTWSSTSGPRIASPASTIGIAWHAVERAAVYRITVRDARGDVIAASEIAASSTSTALALAPGAHGITISALDADGLESAPSQPLALERVVPTFITPSGRASAPAAATPRTVALGTTFVAPAGTTCALGDAASSRLVLDRPGPHSIRCRDALGRYSESLELEVVALNAASSPAGPARVETGTGAPPPRGADWRVELGTYAGFHSVALHRPVALGAATEHDDALDDGPTLGLRGGLYRGRYGVEAEVGWSALDHVAATGRGQVIPIGLHALVRHDEGSASVRLLAGLGLVSVIRDTMSDELATTASMSWGGAATVAVRGVDLRFDLRHALTSGVGGGIGQALQATFGVSIQLAP